MDLELALQTYKAFKNDGLLKAFQKIESEKIVPSNLDVDALFVAAKQIKDAASQINEVVHAAGIMLVIKKWIGEGEKIEYLSLGAGSNKDRFDVETDKRIVEFKFGKWNLGSANGIRRRNYFSNYINLLTANDPREKYFIIEDKEAFTQFLNGKANWRNVLSKNPSCKMKLEEFLSRNNKSCTTVNEIFKENEDVVKIRGFNEIILTSTLG